MTKRKSLTPINFGKKLLVEQSKKVRITDILKRFKVDIKKAFIASELESMGVNIGVTFSKTNYGGVRLWFKCPMCESRVGIVYQYPINNQLGCRQCLNLDYRKHKYKGMIENNIN